ncbi:hypothetical protein D9M69_564000 [compost metagenome]
MADLDAGRKAIGQDPAALAFQHRQQAARGVVIALVQVQGRRELAFEQIGHLQQLVDTARLHYHRRGAEHLGLQRRGAQQALGIRHVQRGLGGIGLPGGLRAARHALDAFQGVHLRPAVQVGGVDTGGQHGLRSLGAKRLAGRAHETPQVRSVDGEHQAGIGAELACAHRQRIGEALGQRLRPRRQRLRQQEHGVDAAHLGIHRNRLVAAVGDA